MTKIKNIILILIILLIAFLNTGCIFTDKMPVFKNLKGYSPEKLEFGITTLENFKKSVNKIPDSDLEIYTDGITIIKLKSPADDMYSFVRVGFKYNKLDWIEFNLANNVKITKLVTVLGNPTNIYKNYNKDFDYYNYDFFNISADKVNKNARSITYFSNSPHSESTKATKSPEIPEKLKKKFFDVFPLIEPGVTTESDFSAQYPDLIPYEENNSETNSMYVLTDELGNSRYYYDKAILKFESGLLAWINLIPKNLPINDCLKNLNNNYKKDNVNSTFELYDFSNFILIVDKKSKLVKSIGVFSKEIKL